MLPAETARSGAAFPQGDLLIFLTFEVILVKLLGQRLSLHFLVGRLETYRQPA
ncbi:MAG TPA: hypothetical protein VME23_22855 [Terracidiphilus sp.]|nr:hypothetical protein [Terracidiphilus sp.]